MQRGCAHISKLGPPPPRQQHLRIDGGVSQFSLHAAHALQSMHVVQGTCTSEAVPQPTHPAPGPAPHVFGFEVSVHHVGVVQVRQPPSNVQRNLPAVPPPAQRLSVFAGQRSAQVASLRNKGSKRSYAVGVD